MAGILPMEMVLPALTLFLSPTSAATSRSCQKLKDSLFTEDEESYFSCPRPADPKHFTDCCGPSWAKKCCAEFTMDSAGASSVVNFFGVVTGVVVLAGVLLLACCCCAPCCLLAKKRKQRGMVGHLNI